MYHFAPIEQRESIEQNGLDSNLGRDPGDTTYNHAHGIYLLPSKIWALDVIRIWEEGEGKKMFDLYAVNVDGLPLQPDLDFEQDDGVMYVPAANPIPPNRITRVARTIDHAR
jgi:hypothetical protein